MRYAHAMPFGASLNASGRGARFRLWAPQAHHVELLLHSADGQLRMITAQAQSDGWREVRCDSATAGEHYQWRIEGDCVVPDPASRYNPQGPHAPSELVDPCAFEWDDAPWLGRPWHELVFYQLHVGSFTPEGGYASAAKHLPKLAELGITAVQLMPLADFPGRHGWGYDGVLLFAPFHGYGRPEELKAFVQAAHRLGLAVFGDVVYNHFGPDGNFLDRYAPQFFSERHRTGWGAAINVDDDERGGATVREFFIANALYWIEEFRFDGLRLDAVHAISDQRQTGFLHELSMRVRAACAGRHVHLVLENDNNECARLAAPGTPGRYDGQWNGDVHHALHVVLTGEHDGYYAAFNAPVGPLGRALTRGFAHCVKPPAPDDTAGETRRRVDFQGQAPLVAIVNMLQTHDQIGNRAFGERLLALADPRAVRLAAAIVLLAPSVPLLFMGEEWGATTPFLYFCDWQGALRKAVCKGRHREFATFPRFADAAQRGELPDPCDEASLTMSRLDRVACTSAEARGWWRFHAELLAVRAQELRPWLPSLLADGHVATHHGALLDVGWAFESGRRLQMRVNLSCEPATMPNEWGGVAAGGASAPLHRIGNIDGDRFGPWSGLWGWLA